MSTVLTHQNPSRTDIVLQMDLFQMYSLFIKFCNQRHMDMNSTVTVTSCRQQVCNVLKNISSLVFFDEKSWLHILRPSLSGHYCIEFHSCRDNYNQKQPSRRVLREGVLKICSKFKGEHPC